MVVALIVIVVCIVTVAVLVVVVPSRSKKMRANIKTLKEMEKLLKAGGTLLWIAPSGGRDRKSADGVLSPDPFDPGESRCNLSRRIEKEM